MDYMIVDDNSLILELLSKIIKSKGNNVIESNSGATAISLMYKFRPDIIILDFDIADIDVATLISIFLEVNQNCYIILNTFENGYDRQTLNLCYIAGAKDVLFKPFNVKQLTKILTKAENIIYAPFNNLISDSLLSE